MVSKINSINDICGISGNYCCAFEIYKCLIISNLSTLCFSVLTGFVQIPSKFTNKHTKCQYIQLEYRLCYNKLNYCHRQTWQSSLNLKKLRTPVRSLQDWPFRSHFSSQNFSKLENGKRRERRFEKCPRWRRTSRWTKLETFAKFPYRRRYQFFENRCTLTCIQFTRWRHTRS